MTMRTLFSVLAVLAALTAGAQPRLLPEEPAKPAGVGAPPASTASPMAGTLLDAPPVEAEGANASLLRATETLSVDFDDEDIRTILRHVADLFEINMVIPDTLQGRTSIKLRNVTWRQIYQVVLSPVGYTFVEDGNITKIVSQESLSQEPVSTEVFVINYARAEDIKKSVEPLVDPASGGKVLVDSRSNSLVISERPSRMVRVRTIIEQLDRPTEQVMIESKFVEVNNSDVKNIGVNWSSLSGYTLTAGGLSKDYSKSGSRSSSNSSSNDALVNSSGASSSSSSSSSTGATGASTSSNVTSTDGTVGSTSSAGSTGNSTSNSAESSSSSQAGDYSNAISKLTSLADTSTITDVTSAVFSADDFSVVLSALKTQSGSRLVSNPTVVTLNNTEALINVGEEYPIPSYTYNQTTDSYQVSGFNYKQIGIILRVTPQVNSRGMIRLSLEPEVSSRTGVATFGNANIPIVATRKSKTQVTLKDGYTMGIGGLLSSDLITGSSKVPVLGDLPGIGRFFRSESKEDSGKNLLIFITARSVNIEEPKVQDIFDPRRVRAAGISESDLPGYRDGSDPFIAPVIKPTPTPVPAKRQKKQ